MQATADTRIPKIVHIACVFILSIGLLACNSPRTARECTFFDDPARSVALDQFDRASAQEWVSSTYAIADERVHITDWQNANQEFALGWQKEHRYRILFRGERAHNLTIQWQESRPTLALVTECLGDPERYFASIATVEAHEVELTLWYPDHNMMVRFQQTYRGIAPTVNAPTLLMTEMVITPPGTWEDIVHHAFVPRGTWVAENTIRGAQPWTGIESIQVLKRVP